MSDHLRVPGRSLAAACALVLALLLGLPGPAVADDSVNLSMCKHILSRMMCKKLNEFSYVGKLEAGVYVISMFYASKSSEMLCAVMPDGQVIIQDRTWRAMRRVVPYTLDSEGRCMTANYSSPECPSSKPIKVCPPKTAKDAKEQARETFWSRPIPKILEEEYKAMKDQNATAAPAPAPAQENGGAQ